MKFHQPSTENLVIDKKKFLNLGTTQGYTVQQWDEDLGKRR